MRPRVARLAFFAILVILASPLRAGNGPGAPARPVHVARIDAAITPATADYIHTLVERAAAADAACLVLRLNTPGGLLSATRSIVTDLLDAPIPVVVYVSPAGAQAASAGVFVTLAAHVAAMAPGTNIGAAHPVTMGGSAPDSTMVRKMTNDAAAFIRTISEKRHRNVAWAEEAVRASVAITETEARAQGVIDCTAATLDALLDSLDGRTVPVGEGTRVLATRGAAVVTIEKTVQERLLDIISDPNIAYIFMMLGIYGLLFELYNPGAIVPGVVGIIALILGLYSLHTLPVNYAGLGLILVGVILFLLEIKVTSYGLLTIGGIAALGLGSVMLFQHESGFDVIGLSWEVILVSLLFSALFFFVAIGMGIRAQRRRPTTGIPALVGATGEAMTSLAPAGQVKLRGEIWAAVAADPPVAPGDRVVVERVDGLTLTVRSTHT